MASSPAAPSLERSFSQAAVMREGWSISSRVMGVVMADHALAGRNWILKGREARERMRKFPWEGSGITTIPGA